MKNIIILTLVSAFQIFFCYASVPISWTVETSRLAPAVFDVVRGETIDLEATFNSSGKPFAVDTEPVSIFWQTNGMGSAWWTAPAAATSNRVSATFTPEMDPGAATVNGFLGSSGSIYRAAFTFRFRHGPGATPNVLPLPTPVIDFSKVVVLNPPWSEGVDVRSFENVSNRVSVIEGKEPGWDAKQDAISDLAAIRAGAAAGATAYQKPSGGIPKSDLAAGVKESLGKADTALQSFEEKDPTVGLTNGTIHIKGQTITPITEHQDVSGFVPYTGAENDVDLNWHQLNGVDSLDAGSVYASDINATYVNVSGSAIFEDQCDYDGWYRPFFTSGEPMASLNEVGVKSWCPDRNYDEYDLVSYGGDIYRCIEREMPSPSTFSPSHWEIPYATVSQIEDATNALAQTIPQKINAAVSANLNTYIDGDTGVEYVGKFYGGSLYYVPTGNVYPPNN